MIPQIKEINFPEYATLSTATASLVDMGDKTITAQVKIDGAIAPDFSYDWEIEFQGERYIQPLRKPQASKSNESINSIIDLTFYHKGIYDLKRYFFVSVPNVESGTVMADDYIVPLQLNLKEFVVYLNKVFEVYHDKYRGAYKAFLNPNIEIEASDKKTIDINYTKIWDVIAKIYELFGVRWYIEESDQGDDLRTYSIKIGYPPIEVSHIFEYGFQGGLLKLEQQVQNVEIANMVFGRGSSENIPFRYFKNKSEDNPTFPADPDWIPELENVYFANLRGKTFRDYVKGWKSNPNRDTLNGTLEVEPIDPDLFLTSFAYNRGLTDAKFAPIEYVKDDESIDKYGEIQKGLEHNEEIKPTIQGVTIEGVGRVDQIVDVEPILVDESTENTELASDVQPVSENVVTWYDNAPSNDMLNISIAFPTIDISTTKVAHIVKDILINIVQHVRCTEEFSKYDAVNNKWHILSTRTIQKENPLKVDSINVGYIDEKTNTPIDDLANIDKGVRLAVVVEAKVSGFFKKQTNIPHPNPNYSAYTGTITPDSTFKIITSLDTEIDYTPIHGQILGNYESGATRKSQVETIPANGTSQVVFTTEQFTITEDNAPATNVDMPFRITSSLKGGEYDPRPNVVAINVETGEQMTSLNLPAGTYYLRNSIQIVNLASEQQTFKVELLPTYIYYSYDSESWKPTFDIWVKNIWQTMPEKLESDYAYEHRIWDAILGDHLGNEAKVVFSSGRLSGHTDWEFLIADTPKRDTSKTIDGVPSEWRITLYKSDAEMEATDKWLPSIMTQASAGDHFYFVGIEMPHQYVLWAEKKLDEYKLEELHKVSNVKPTIVVQLDKVRVTQAQDNETRPLLDSLRIGNNIRVAEVRFIESEYEALCLQSINYIWDASTIILPNIEIVLSNEIVVSSNPLSDIRNQIDNVTDSIDAVRKLPLTINSKLKNNIRQIESKVNVVSSDLSTVASDRQLYISSIIDLDAEVKAINTDYENFVATYSRVLDSDGKILLDSEGRILYVRDADLVYSDLQRTYEGYKAQLQSVVSSNGIVNINASFDNARNEYYSVRKYMLNKISNATKIKISDLDYLKQTFGEDSVLDTHAVVLGDLVAVKDEDGDVVAGIYGGANSTLNDSGYTDSGHGALMMFAGAENAQGANNAKFRAYSDGTIFASDGVFSGLVRHKTVYVTKSNVDEYFPMYNGYRKISPMQMSSIISFWDLPVIGEEKFTSEDRLEIMLPILHGGRVEDVGQVVSGNATYLRELVGVKFLVYNTTDAFISFCGRRYDASTDTLDEPTCYGDWAVGNESMAIAECKIGLRADKTEIIYWDVQVGSMGL